jgi:hypothetical protein
MLTKWSDSPLEASRIRLIKLDIISRRSSPNIRIRDKLRRRSLGPIPQIKPGDHE